MLKNKPLVITVSALVLLALIVLLQNSSAVTLRFLFWKFAAPQYVVLSITFLLGALIGTAIFFWRLRAKSDEE